MTKQEFETNMIAAKSFSGLSDNQDFWHGYMRGLRRNHHGEKFGTESEHSLCLDAINSEDETQKMRSIGYHAGFEGQSIQQAMEKSKGE